MKYLGFALLLISCCLFAQEPCQLSTVGHGPSYPAIMSKPTGIPKKRVDSAPPAPSNRPKLDLGVSPIQQYFLGNSTTFSNVFTTPGNYQISVNFNGTTNGGQESVRRPVEMPPLQNRNNRQSLGIESERQSSSQIRYTSGAMANASIDSSIPDPTSFRKPH